MFQALKLGMKSFGKGELSIARFHHEFHKGIAWVKLFNSKVMVTSIVDSDRYENVMWVTSDKLFYYGEYETLNIGGVKKAKDQKLVGGNLTMENNMDEKNTCEGRTSED
ncbi:hypothetical protein PTKIN_Ptkin17bG0088800 [Pterospermum kingtungense]